MKTTLMTFADLGDYNNLKTRESEEIYSALYKFDKNTKIICRDFKNYNCPNIVRGIPLGKFIPQFLEFLKIIFFSKFNSRYYSEKLFDFFVSKKIKDVELAFLIPPRYSKTIKRLKSNKSVIVGYGSVCHPSFVNLQKEKLNLQKNISFIDIYKENDYIITLSSFAKKTYVDAGFDKNKVFVTPLGIDYKKFWPSVKKDSIFRVICVGDYGKLKGFDLVLEAWEELKLSNAELVFIGNPDQDMKEIVNIYSSKLDNFKTISHTNPLSYYQQASLLVHPSLSDSWGKVVTEAMACEVPTIVSQYTGAKDAITNREDGIILNELSKQCLKKEILYAYNNQNKLQEMGKKARQKIITEFTWQQFSQKVEKTLRDICKKERYL